MLVVVSSLNCFVFRAERTVLNGTVQGDSWMRPRPHLASYKMPPLVPVGCVGPWELTAQQGVFSWMGLRTFCKIASSWVFDGQWLFLWGIRVSSGFDSILAIFVKGANSHGKQKSFWTLGNTQSSHWTAVAADWPCISPSLLLKHNCSTIKT